jgi:hypothetical protein
VEEYQRMADAGITRSGIRYRDYERISPLAAPGASIAVADLLP